MPTTIHNRTLEEIEIIDYYLRDARSGAGYSGRIRYQIPAGGERRIRSSVFFAALKEQMETQRIEVKINGETRKVLLYENFKENEEVIFEMHDGVMAVRYVPRTGTSLANHIRRNFGCGRNFGG